MDKEIFVVVGILVAIVGGLWLICLSANETTTESVNKDCYFLKHVDSKVWGQDVTTKGIYCKTDAVPR